MIASKREVLLGRLIVLVAIVYTLIPLLSMLSAALQPQGTIPRGFGLPPVSWRLALRGGAYV